MSLSNEEMAVIAAYGIFDTESGRVVLRDLERVFCDLSYVAGAMDYKAGEAEVVMRIRRMRHFARHPAEAQRQAQIMEAAVAEETDG